MNDRRRFLQQSAMLSLSPLVPSFLTSSALAADSADGPVDGSVDGNGRILVVIQLSGGNDGINTVVPFKDDGYAKNRSKLRLLEKDLIKLSDEVALNSRLRSVSELLEADRLSIVHGVGYPNPSRSHFESMSIWHTAATDAEQRATGNGWLGSAISPQEQRAIYIGKGELPVALRGRRCHATSLLSLSDLHLAKPATDVPVVAAGSNSLRDFVTRSVSDAYVSAKELRETAESDSLAEYPGSRLAKQLQTIGQLIKSGSASQIYYTSQPGYDTHSDQQRTHANLLGTLSSSLKAFMNDMRDAGLEDRILVMAFSEFGRRVNENASQGTDHGTAGPVFLAGTKLQQRVFGKIPSLTDLHDGDVKHSTDFRRIYVSILTDWLELQPATALDRFDKMKLFS